MRRSYISGTLLENTICYKTQFDLNKITSHPPLGFPGGTVVKKKSACQCRRHGFDPWIGKIPWSRKWQPTPVFLPGEFHERGSLVGDGP